MIHELELMLIFRRFGKKSIVDARVKCKGNEKISVIIERYIRMSGDKDSSNLEFLYNSQPLNYNLTVEEVGLKNGSFINVTERFVKEIIIKEMPIEMGSVLVK